MRELFENDDCIPFAIQLTEDIEAETMITAIGRLLDDAEREVCARTEPIDSFKYHEGRFIVEAFANDLAKGVRVFFPDADFFLSKLALRNFRDLFDSSVAEHTYKETAAALGISPDDFVDRAVTAHRMLKRIP